MTTKTVLITGATSGIGMACAKLFAKHNYRLILTGRRQDRLQEIQAELQKQAAEVMLLCFDVRNKKEVEDSLNSLPEVWRNIDILINNAGLAVGLSTVSQGDTDDWERMIDTNVKGLLYVSKVISNWMTAQGFGHIINVSSIAGKESYPNGAVYCGSKHAVSAISKAMRIELLPHGIKVSTVCPGAVETEFSLVRFKGNQQKADEVYNGFEPLRANDVAEAVWFMASRPSHVNIDDLLIMPTAQASARDFHKN
ncbi:MAG: SDR family oxidoreductase [Mangrovibacterium sp.]